MKQKFYAVKNGRHIGVYHSWTECEQEIKGFPNAKFKSFPSEKEAISWINDEGVIRENNFDEDDSDFIIYTDGSCLKNPGAGGYAAVIIDKTTGELEEISGGESYTTNNRMELSAALFALSYVKHSAKITLITDSSYLKNAFTQNWIKNWKKRNWKTTENTDVKNRDLWEKLLKEVDRHKINFRWVKGHAGNPQNERCDFLAREEAKKYEKL